MTLDPILKLLLGGDPTGGAIYPVFD